jgi:hypothetical protein
MCIYVYIYVCILECVFIVLTFLYLIHIITYVYTYIYLQAVKDSVVAQIDMKIFRCLNKLDHFMSKTVARNFVFNLLDSLTECVPLLA